MIQKSQENRVYAVRICFESMIISLKRESKRIDHRGETIRTLSRYETFNFGPEIPHGWSRPYSKGPTAWAADGSRYENRRAIVISSPFIPPWCSYSEIVTELRLDEDLLFLAHTQVFTERRALRGFDGRIKLYRCRLFKVRPIFHGMEIR